MKRRMFLGFSLGSLLAALFGRFSPKAMAAGESNNRIRRAIICPKCGWPEDAIRRTLVHDMELSSFSLRDGDAVTELYNPVSPTFHVDQCQCYEETLKSWNLINDAIKQYERVTGKPSMRLIVPSVRNRGPVYLLD
jgi:hypothetical protein